MSPESNRLLRGLTAASILLTFAIALPAFGADPPSTDEEKAFYSIGTSLARQLESLEPISKRELQLLVDGLSDAVNDEPLVVEQREGANLVRNLVNERQGRAVRDRHICVHPMPCVIYTCVYSMCVIYACVYSIYKCI